MVKRAYTVIEIDELREAIRDKLVWGSYHGPQYDEDGDLTGYTHRLHSTDDQTKVVEEVVRTHMLAGHTAADLLASEPQRATA